MRPFITLHNGHKLGLRQEAVPVSLIVPVTRNAVGDFEYDFFIQVQPVNPDGTMGAVRPAASGECVARVQYPWGASQWTDFASVETDVNGKATIIIRAQDARYPSQYRVTGKHIASGAEIGMTFNIDGMGNVGPMSSPIVISAGSTQPATFLQQERSGYMRPIMRQLIRGGHEARNLAIGEVRNYPFNDTAGMHQEGRADTFGFPEVRQWPSAGPNPALPGVLVRVRQNNAGPAFRVVMI